MFFKKASLIKEYQGTFWGVRNVPYVNRGVGSEEYVFVEMHCM